MNERIQAIIRHPLTLPTTVGVVAFGGGLVTGYILGKRNGFHLQLVPELKDLDVYDEEAPQELRDVVIKSIEFGPNGAPNTGITEVIVQEGDPVKNYIREKLQSKLEERLWTEGDEAIEENELDELPQPEQETVRRNIFENSGDEDWDYEEELKNRSSEEPYILHRDEFFSSDTGFAQITLSYYAADDIMADEDNTPVYNHTQVVGELKFGHGSGDPNVFYARNEKRKAEYEIVSNEGYFSVEVLGLEIEDNERAKDLKHSHNRKFRPDD